MPAVPWRPPKVSSTERTLVSHHACQPARVNCLELPIFSWVKRCCEAERLFRIFGYAGSADRGGDATPFLFGSGAQVRTCRRVRVADVTELRQPTVLASGQNVLKS